MQLIKIDPTTQTIEAVELSHYIAAVAEELDPELSPENGLFWHQFGNTDYAVSARYNPEGKEAFSINGLGPFHGATILTGDTGREDDHIHIASPIMTLEEAKEAVQWLGQIPARYENYRRMITHL